MQLDREGRFRAKPASRAVVMYSSGSVALELSFIVLAEEKNGEWIPLEHVEFSGSIFMLGRGGRELAGQVSVASSLGWNGDWTQLEIGSDWTPSDCMIDVKIESYNGENRLKLGYLHPIKANYQSLQGRYGAKSRALLAGGPLPPKPPPLPPQAAAPPEQECPF